MKTLKQEVGKIYRSRIGEEVRIVKKDGDIKYPFEGSDGEWYAENGRFDLYVAEASSDLIEEIPTKATRHTFAIPDGVKRVTVEHVGNRIVVEMVPEKEPKPGDVMINENGSVYIFKSVRDDRKSHNHYAWFGEDGRLSFEWACYSGRPATPEDAQPLWDALRKAGKKWNAETMEVEDVPESTRILEWVENHLSDGYYNHADVAEAIEDYLKHKEGKNENNR